MLKKTYIVVAALLLAILVTIPVLSGCGGAPKPDTVKVGYLADLTGPYAAVGQPLVDGFSDYFEMINERDGGIEGVPVEVLWEDTGAAADRSVTAYKRLKNAGVVAVSCMVTPVALAVQSMLAEDKIPGINQSATLSLYIPPQDYMWCHGAVAVDNDLAFLYYFNEELWPKDAGQWTLGVLAHDNPFALGSMAAIYKFADTYNVKLAQPEVVALGTMDYGVNLKRLADAGVDLLILETLGASTGVVLKQLGEMDMLATVADAAKTSGQMVPFLGQTSFYGNQIAVAREEAKYVYGSILFYLPNEEENAGVREINDFMRQKYGELIPGDKGGEVYRDGWNNAIVMSEAIKRAVKKVGWDNLTGETLVENGLKGLEVNVGFFPKLSYNDYEGDRLAAQMFRPGAWNMERWDREPIGDWIDVPKLMGDLRVTKYMTTQAGPGWYKP